MNRFQTQPRTLGLLLAALAMAGLGLLAARSNAAGNDAAPAGVKPALTVTLTQARVSVLPLKLIANGNVVAWQEAIIGAEVNGLRVQELNAGIGDQVQKGQLLATFAAESVQADVALARGSKPPPSARYSATQARWRSSWSASCVDSDASAMRRASSSSITLASPCAWRACVAASSCV